MSEPLQFLLLGLGLGGVYALIAQGVVLVYRGSGVLNFAHGAMGAIGAYAYFEAVEAGVPQGAAVVIGVAASALGGALTYLLVMRWLRTSSPVTRLVATLGVLAVVQQALILEYGTTSTFVDPILPANVWTFFSGVTVPSDRIYILLVACVLTVALWLVFRFTRFGWATVAVAENERATATMGWSPEVIAVANWSLGAALAGLAAILILPILGLSVVPLTLLIIPALATALVGGFRSFPLALAGGLAIGVAESELTRYVSDPGWATSVPFLVIVVVLALRGDALPLRGEALFRLPRVGTGRVPIWIPVAAFLLGWWWIGASDATGALVLASTFAIALVMLSLIVVTGYAGQLSLAQFALAGMGAFVAGRLADVAGWPFPVVVVIGVAVALPIGVLVALPALRTRGISLAIATFGLALAIERIVLGNSDFTGGFAGTVVDRPTLFGWEIDSLLQPKRYALVCLVALLVVVVMVANLRRGPAGRRLLAVRANERAAVALGISAVRAKLFAFALASAIAALGGILFAFRSSQIDFSPFNVNASINAVVFTVLPGIGFLASSVLSAAAQPGNLLPHLFSELDWDRYFQLVGGLLLIVTIIKAPDGALDPVFRQLRHLAAWARRTMPWLPRRRPAVAPSDPKRAPVPPARLHARGISVHFGGVRALQDVAIEVEPGTVTGLIGPNGAGKTTLIDVLSGFTAPDEGTVELDRVDITHQSPRRRSLAGLGRSFQHLELFEDMTVGDNLRVAGDPRSWVLYLSDLFRPRRAPLPPAARAAIEDFGLADDLDKLPSALPHGRRRLVGIARAVAGQPSILFLDEPAAGLDERQRRELGLLVRRLAQDWGIAVLLIEHDVPLVTSVCDRVVALDFGRVIASGTPAQVIATPAVVAAYLGADVAERDFAPTVDDVAPTDSPPARTVRP